jgi:glyoxylase-like metal-dependent hydrolase (beta-lactamase superfamily II)
VYALHRAYPDITQITLPKPGMAPLFGTPANVYLLHGDAPALIGTGHRACFGALECALDELGLRVGDVERVLALDWSPDQLGAADRFGHADVLVAADHGSPIRDYGRFLQSERTAFDAAAALLNGNQTFAAVDAEELAAQRDQYFDGPDTLDLITVPGGRSMALGARSFTLATAPGPCPGHAILWDGATRMLFSSRLVIERSFGRPNWRDVASYVSTLEQLHDLAPATLLPTFGRIDDDARYALTRTHRAVTGLLGHLPFAVQKQLTLADMLYLDLGRVPAQHPRLVETARTRKACLDYLVSTSALDRAGDGPDALYGAAAPISRSMIG